MISVKGFAADVLHHDEQRILEFAGVVDVDDVGVVQRGERAGLTDEPLASSLESRVALRSLRATRRSVLGSYAR